MGTADFNLSLTMRGTPEEMRSMLDVLMRYTNEEASVYFQCPTIALGDDEAMLEYIDDEGLDLILSEATDGLQVSAGGPYGRYAELDEIDIFRYMAKTAPNAYFEGGIEGYTSYTEQSVECELKDGRLRIKTFFASTEDASEAYIEYFMERLPYEDFVKIFHISAEDFDEDSYRDFIDCCVAFTENGLNDLDYEDFCSELEDCVGLTEEEYAEAIERCSQLGIMSCEEYSESSELGERHEYEYDPVSGECIGAGRVYPFAGQSDPVEINETIRKYLDENGFPCDDADIDALSLEDVYAIIAGTYGKEILPGGTDGTPTEKEATEEAHAGDTPVEDTPIEEISTEETAAGYSPVGDAHNEDIAPAAPEKKRSKAWVAWLVVAVAAAIIAAAAVYCPFVSGLMETAWAAISALFK